MRLADNLRKAEEKGVMSIRRGVDRVREEWTDVERRIRQHMRIYPKKQAAMAAAVPNGQINIEQDAPEAITSAGETRTPIVSIHGHDLSKP